MCMYLILKRCVGPRVGRVAGVERRERRKGEFGGEKTEKCGEANGEKKRRRREETGQETDTKTNEQ